MTASHQPQVFEDHRDGQHYRTSAVPVMDRDGEGVPGGDFFFFDITAQHGPAFVARQRGALPLSAENSEDVIWQLDRDMHITYISAADQRLRGVAAGRCWGNRCSVLFSPRGQAIGLARAPASGGKPAATAHPVRL